ncbi:MAG: hypothetical protein ACYC7D_15705 [Nitrososphaerales archaeon]
MTSVFITVQARESDNKAAELLRHLMERKTVSTVPFPIDPKTVLISFDDIQPDAIAKIVSDSKEWSEDSGFVFLANQDVVHSKISLQKGTIEKERATVISLLEL